MRFYVYGTKDNKISERLAVTRYKCVALAIAYWHYLRYKELTLDQVGGGTWVVK